MTSLDVIIVQHNQADLTVRCIESIRVGYPQARLIFVDNGSDDAEREQVVGLLSPRDTMVRNQENRPFAVAVNQALTLSRAPFVCLQNNDTIVGEGDYQRLLDRFADHRVGAVGPLTDGADTEQKASEAGVGFAYTEMLSFFCCILRRRAIEDLGPLSEEFGQAYGEDDDYCRRLVQAGWKLVICRDVWVQHDHHATARVVLGQEGIDREGAQAHAKLAELYGDA